jgi:hypothetical protein
MLVVYLVTRQAAEMAGLKCAPEIGRKMYDSDITVRPAGTPCYADHSHNNFVAQKVLKKVVLINRCKIKRIKWYVLCTMYTLISDI